MGGQARRAGAAVQAVVQAVGGCCGAGCGAGCGRVLCGAGCGAGCGWVLRCWLWCRLWARAVWCWLWCRLWASSAGLPTAAPCPPAQACPPTPASRPAPDTTTSTQHPPKPAPTLLKATNSMVCSSRQKGRSPAQRHPTAPCSAACALLNTLRGGGPGAELSPCSATWFPGGSRAAEPQRAPPHQRPRLTSPRPRRRRCRRWLGTQDRRRARSCGGGRREKT